MSYVKRGLLLLLFAAAFAASSSGCSDDKGGSVSPPPGDDADDTGEIDPDGDDDLGDGTTDGGEDGGDEDGDTDDSDSDEPELGDLGDDCFADSDCKSSLCVEREVLDPDQCSDLEDDEICGFCSRQCESTADCAGSELNLSCTDYQPPGGDSEFIQACLPRRDVTCTRCEDSQGNANISACSPELGNQCLEFVDGFFCTLNCNNNPGICPDGTQCLTKYDTDGDGTEDDLPFAQCIPDSRQCTDCFDPDGDDYGVGEGCLGTDCDESNTSINEGAVEICDLAGVDSNCDNNPNPIDVDFTTDVNNCGGCQIACTPANAAPQCQDSTCGIDECNEFYYDLNGDYDDGCEYECINQNLEIVDIPDANRRDTDCDGIDGASSEAIFVSAASNASNGNPGTREQPVRDIWRGIELAETNGKSQVLVSSGTFTGPSAGPFSSATFEMTSGISVYGGYDQSNWNRNPANNITVMTTQAPVAVRFSGITDTTRLAGLTIEGTSFTGTNSQSTYALWIENSGNNPVLEEVIVNAGNAANGQSGGDASNGPAGSSGGNADRTTRGGGGSSTCGATGGRGGNGRDCDNSGSQAGGDGSAGSDRLNGQNFTASGGDGGAGGDDECGCALNDEAGDAPAPGTSNGAQNGNRGDHGDGGSRSNDSVGSFSASSGWSGTSGDNGENGENGTGGGGGGSGGADQDGPGFGCSGGDPGSGGGGGGAGGCGGEGGKGGEPGGASFGMVVINSSPDVSAVQIQRGSGGEGGDGSAGGDGGSGGSGGAFFNTDEGGAFSNEVGNGADGADGGDGGGGGGGAGACGGPAVGVALIDGASVTEAEFDIYGGAGGQGGSGGSGGKRDGTGISAPSGASGCGGALLEFQSY